MASFATPAEMATFMGQPTPADPARFQAYLDAASALIRRFTGQTLSEVIAETVTLEPIDRDTMILPQRPVTAISSLLVLGVAFTAYRFTRTGFVIMGATPSTTEGSFWTNGATITYNHGYATSTDEYGAIKAICLESAVRGISERGSGQFGQIDTMTSTIVDAVGFTPRIFLTDREQWQLMDLGKVGVG